MTMSATEDAPAPVQAIPLNSLQALTAWRQHKEAGLRAPLSPTAQAAVQRVHAANARIAAEPLPKRVRGASDPMLPYSTHPHALLPVAEPEPEDPAAAHEQASKADLARWAPGQDLADEKADEALENLLDIHDTDPAGETAVLNLDAEEDE